MSVPTKVVKTKLFIGNLDPATQAEELTELFSAYGAVLEASVIKDYGFVHFGSIEEAEKAAAALNNQEFHGKRLRVELSTSTVRHRPGQPEPASALRNSRARAAVVGGANGVSRYSPAAPPGGGGGPMRHSASAWARSDSRPYEGMPIDPAALSAGYGSTLGAYERPRSYDTRSDPRQYYADRRESGYGPGYDAAREHAYGAPAYGAGGSGQAGVFPMRDYSDLPPHARPDPLAYSQSRVYDRNQGASPVDPYYAAGYPPGHPGAADPYQNYDPYQKQYASRSRDSDFALSTSQNPPARDYDPYSLYRSDPYGSTNGQAPPRHEMPVAYPPQQAGYPVPNQQRPSQAYGNTSTPSYPPSLAQYYGAQQRA